MGCSTNDKVFIEIKRGDEQVLPEKDANIFNEYLLNRRNNITNVLPKASIPKKYHGFKEVIKHILANLVEYPNREMNCKFLKTVNQNLSENYDKIRLEEITNNFEICIPADLPKEKQHPWYFSILTFLWDAKWIEYKKEKISLYRLTLNTLNLKKYEPISIEFWNNERPDAFYSSLSKQDKKFINSNTPLKALFTNLKKVSMNNPPSFRSLSLKSYYDNQSIRFADVFLKKKTMYFSMIFGPIGLVDTLVHEFGHIYFDEKHLHFTKKNGIFLYKKNTIHDEACAESLAWLVVSGCCLLTA